MAGRRRAWVFLADAAHGRLLRCGTVPGERCHVEEIDRIDCTWEGHQHERPTPRIGKSGHSYASAGHDVDEDLDRFARQVARWLELRMADLGIDRMVTLTPPRFLGAFRKVRSEQLASRLQDRQGDLIGLAASELSNHPSIRELVGLSVGRMSE